MIPVISFVGSSGSGKTALLEKVVAELKRRGLKIAVIKHSHHDRLEFDQEGKDSYRYTQAGADVVIVSGTKEMVIMEKTDRDMSPREICRLIDNNIDLVLTEGFKNADTAKIEIHREDLEKGLLSNPEHLLAVITDKPLKDIQVPQFDYTKDNTGKIADLIEEWLAGQGKESVKLFVNGDFVPMKPFVRDIFTRTIEGMVSSLKGVNDIQSLDLSIRRER